MKKRSQVANEFMIIVGIVIVALLLVLSLTSSDVARLSADKEEKSMKDIGLSVQKEINLAAKVHDGYSREFEIPDKYNGFEYSISTFKNTLVVKSVQNKIELVFFVPNSTGTIKKGLNIIKKEGGAIYLN